MSDLTPPRPGTDAPEPSAQPTARRAVTAITQVAAGVKINPFERAGYAQHTSAGYGNAMGRGFELTLTLVVIGGIGWLVDRLVGTSPIFTLTFALLGFAGIATKLWLGYDLEMREHEEGAIWNRKPGDDANGPVIS